MFIGCVCRRFWSGLVHVHLGAFWFVDEILLDRATARLPVVLTFKYVPILDASLLAGLFVAFADARS